MEKRFLTSLIIIIIISSSCSSSKNLLISNSIIVPNKDISKNNSNMPILYTIEMANIVFLSNQLYFDGKYSECILNYNNLILKHPEYSVAYYNRGLARYYNGDLVGAKSDLNKAVSLGMNDAKLLLLKFFGN